MQWENVHIFISSTFNDMHAERDYLVKNVFPALSEWCEERKLRLIDIDLRWGVTAADSEAKNTVRACLRNIDECRPFFLCFLGQRRGWVPSSDDIGKDTYELFPNLLQKHYVGDTSVTELEILHALIDPLHNGILRNTKDDSRSGKAVEYAFFYLREQDYLKSIPHPDLRGVYTNEAERDQTTADKELACWREQEIPQTGRPVYSYIANWRKGENTPEIAMPLYVPTTAPKDSDVWKLAFDNWKKRWSETGIIVDDSGEITGGELKKAKNYNKDYTSGRLGDFFVKKQILNLLPLSVPCRAPKESDKWKNAFIRWKKHWFDVGVSVNEDGEITESELNKAKTYNESLIELSGKCQMKDRPLADVIIEQLKAAIAKRYPDHMTIYASTPLQKEIDQQAQFLRISSEGFIERAGDFDEFHKYIQNDERRPLAVTAYTGMGKTSLLAHFIDTYRLHENESLHYRFIGGSDDTVNVERLVRSLLSELKDAGKINTDIPVNSSEMINKLPDLLTEAGRNNKIILIIDALNQLESGMTDLYWIPSILPENVKLIVSFKCGEESADEYYFQQTESGAMILHGVKPFDDLSDRKALVTAYLEQYFKELDEPRIQALIESEGAENPLFLKAVLSELRVFGVHNDLSEVIRTRFGNTPAKAFQAILERMENDPAYTKLTPAVALPHIFGWIAHSRYGMSTNELADLLIRENLTESREDSLDSIYLILRQLRPFLARRDGRVDFFYDSFKIAAVERYTRKHPYARSITNRHKSLAEYFKTLVERYTRKHPYARNITDWHKSLAEYFETLPLDNRHRLMEQALQFVLAGNGAQLSDLLLNDLYLKNKAKYLGVYNLIQDFELTDYLEIYSEATAELVESIKIIKQALILSAEKIKSDPDLLPFQLLCRVNGGDNPVIERFLENINSSQTNPWLRPMNICLPAAGGTAVTTIAAIGKTVRHLSSSGDGKILLVIAGSGESFSYIYDSDKKRFLNSGNYNFGAISSDGRLAALFDYDHAYIYSLNTRNIIKRIPFFKPQILKPRRAGFCNNMLWVFACNRELMILNPADGNNSFQKINYKITDDKINIHDGLVLSDGKRAIVLTDNKAFLIKVKNGTVIRSVKIPGSFCSTVTAAEKCKKAFIPDGSNNCVYIWEYEKRNKIQTVSLEDMANEKCEPNEFQVSPDGNILFTYGFGSPTFLYKKEKDGYQTTILNQCPTAAVLYNNGQRMFSATGDDYNYDQTLGEIRAYNLSKHDNISQGQGISLLGVINAFYSARPYGAPANIKTGFLFEADSDGLIYCDKASGLLNFFKINNNRTKNNSYPTVQSIDRLLSSVHLSPTCVSVNYASIFVGMNNGALQVFNKADLSENTCMKIGDSAINGVFADNDSVFAATDSGQLYYFKIEDLITRAFHMIPLFTKAARDVRIICGGRGIAVIGDDLDTNNIVRILYISASSELCCAAEQQIDSGNINSAFRIIGVSPDGKTIVLEDSLYEYGRVVDVTINCEASQTHIETSGFYCEHGHYRMGSFSILKQEDYRRIIPHPITGGRLTDNLRFLISLTGDKVILYDRYIKSVVQIFEDKDGDYLLHCAVNGNGRFIVTASRKNMISVWDTKLRGSLFSLQWDTNITAVDFCRDNIFCLICQDGSVSMIKIENI